MCGIAGAFLQQRPTARRLAQTMAERIGHRGPDAESGCCRTCRPTASSHRRVALRWCIAGCRSSTSRPRRTSRSSRTASDLGYNGELYNYRELRAELEARASGSAPSPTPRSSSRPGGAGGPPALASAGCSRSRSRRAHRRLVLARDPLGIKPLFVLPRGSGHRVRLRAQGAGDGRWASSRSTRGARRLAMLYYWVPEEPLRHRGVDKLPAGSWAEWRADGRPLQVDGTGTRSPRRWPAAATAPTPDLAAVLEESVSAHLIADVPVSTFLSGGLDSSLVTALAAAATPPSRPTRSRSGPRTRSSRRCPTTRATPARWPRSSDPAARDRDRAGRGRPAAADGRRARRADRRPGGHQHRPDVPAAREAGVKVLLSGMGADELFGGYRKHLACLLWLPATASAPRALPPRGGAEVDRLPVAAGGRGLRYSPLGQALRVLRRAAGGGGLPPELHPVRPAELQATCSTPSAPHVDDVVDEHAASTTDTGSTDHVNRMCLTDLRLFLPGSTWPTPTARAWRRRPRCGCRSSTRGVPGGVLLPGRPEDQRPDAGRLLKRAAEGVAARGDRRPAEGPVRRSAAGLGHQRPRAS